jgi:hypothetical protein
VSCRVVYVSYGVYVSYLRRNLLLLFSTGKRKKMGAGSKSKYPYSCLTCRFELTNKNMANYHYKSSSKCKPIIQFRTKDDVKNDVMFQFENILKNSVVQRIVENKNTISGDTLKTIVDRMSFLLDVVDEACDEADDNIDEFTSFLQNLSFEDIV